MYLSKRFEMVSLIRHYLSFVRQISLIIMSKKLFVHIDICPNLLFTKENSLKKLNGSNC